MNSIGILVLGESDFVSYQHTMAEAKKSAAYGADYIKTNSKDASHPVSIVGLMLDGDWLDGASDHEKGMMGGVICGICHDLIFQSKTYHTEVHRTFKQPTFLFTAFKRRLDAAGYDYYLRMVGVVEWDSTPLLCAKTMEAFKLAQTANRIDYADDSICSHF